MSDNYHSLVNAALALPENERASLVDVLLETLSPDDEGYTEDELLAELNRRRSEIASGVVKAVPWSDFSFEK
jgi:putative addiction module component (TIGR02574 family)